MTTKADFKRAGEKYLLLGACVLYVVYVARNAFRIADETYFSLFDDAMISMRYAQSLAEGHGLVWNPGEAPVEGYTNFLWTLLMSGAHLLGLPDSKVSLVVLSISGVCLLANALVVRGIADRISGGNPRAILTALLLTLFSYPLIFWALRGMEVGFLMLLVDLAILASLDLKERFRGSSVALLCVTYMLAVLTRPDSVGPVAVVGAFAVLMSGGRDRVKVALALGGSVGITLAAHTAFRQFYYHDTLPNTYYLKMTGTPLAARLAVGIPALIRTIVLELWPMLLVPLAVLVRSPRRFLPRGRQLLLVLLVSQCAYSVYVGGDAWEQLTIANRYISIALPGAFVLMGTLLAELSDEANGADLRFVSVLVAAFALLSLAGACFYHFTSTPIAISHVRAGQLVPYALLNAAVAAVALYIWKRGLPGAELRSWALLLAPIWVALNGMAFATWKKNYATVVDQEMSRIGVLVKEASQPNARIAVTYAGAPPYFSRLPSVDLLGKCDSVVSRKASYLPFLPGHSKWDYQYSLTTYRPDLILQTMRLNQEDRVYFAKLGYVRLPNGVYILKGTPLVDEKAIAAMPFQMHHIFEEP